MTAVGIILAGGRATRLGPLTAQLNKSLVSVGQRPMIAHHLELMRNAGVDEVFIVTSPSSQQQVADVIDRSHADIGMEIHCVTQPDANGPMGAIVWGASAVPRTRQNDPVYIIMADTYISEPLPAIGGGWVGVAPATAKRSWCYVTDAEWYDEGVVDVGETVCIGVYGFSSVWDTLNAASLIYVKKVAGQELPMAPFLNRMDIDTHEEFSSWLDVGDVNALAHARRKKFITRDFNSLELTDQGVIIKHGAGEQLQPEIEYFKSLTMERSLLFPRYLGRTVDGGYKMEYVDTPSLAELYLYWPGRPEMWSDVLETVLSRLSRDLWLSSNDESVAVEWHNDMYVYKVHERLKSYEHEGGVVEWGVVEKLQEWLAINHKPEMVRGHGDLNFGNILYSLGSGTFKLVDPRGDVYVDLYYELAKLRYSYRDGFSAICHNLFALTETGVVFGPQRGAESEAMDRVLSNLSDLRRVTAIEATIFLSAAQLHTGEQRLALYRQGIKLAHEVLGVKNVATA